MSWTNQRLTLDVALTPGPSPRIYICMRQRRQRLDPSAAPVIPTRIKSASTIATWISFGSTPPNALFPMECQATEAFSEADVRLVDNLLQVMGERVSAAFVLSLTQTLSAVTFVCQVPCRQCLSGASTKSLAPDDSLMTFCLLLFLWEKWKPLPPLLPFTLRVST